MRNVQVSVDVFQSIWAARKPGQDSEDAILRGVFGLKPAEEPNRDMTVTVGFYDPRYGVEIPNGFEIFRKFKGKTYKAQAIQGFWVLGRTSYPTLNELNKSLGGGAENAWKAWWYRDDKGRRRPLSDLRDQNTIIRRSA
ncbi:MAG: hypothetical protein ABL919_16365 [Methylococcales bacterium]